MAEIVVFMSQLTFCVVLFTVILVMIAIIDSILFNDYFKEKIVSKLRG